jgi:hypothetical protein
MKCAISYLIRTFGKITCIGLFIKQIGKQITCNLTGNRMLYILKYKDDMIFLKRVYYFLVCHYCLKVKKKDQLEFFKHYCVGESDILPDMN